MLRNFKLCIFFLKGSHFVFVSMYSELLSAISFSDFFPSFCEYLRPEKKEMLIRHVSFLIGEQMARCSSILVVTEAGFRVIFSFKCLEIV